MNYPLGIIQFPSKRWGFVGSVPLQLTQNDEHHDSLVFGSKVEAVTLANSIGFYSSDGVNFYPDELLQEKS